MEQIPTMIDGVTSLSATFFNQIPDEIENAILSTGQVLTNADLNQLVKAVAVYAARGDYYDDVGVADDYQLAAQAPMQSPPDDNEGTLLRFRVGNTNTGPATVTPPGLASRTIVRMDGSALQGGDMTGGDLVWLQRRATFYRLIPIEQITTAFHLLGSLAFKNQTAIGDYVAQSILTADIGLDQITSDRISAALRTFQTVKDLGFFTMTGGTTILDIANIFDNTPDAEAYLFLLRARTSNNAQQLQMQFYEGGSLLTGVSDYCWANLSLTSQNNDPADSAMEINPFVTVSGGNIISYTGALFVTHARNAGQRTMVSGSLVTNNDDADGSRQVIVGNGRNAPGLTDGVRFFVTGGGADFQGGGVQVYALDQGL